MKKSIIILFFTVSVVHINFAQQIRILPFIGQKIDVSHGKKSPYDEYPILHYQTKRFSYYNNTNFGVKVEYVYDKVHLFSTGLIINDRAYTQIKYSFKALKENNTILVKGDVNSGIKLFKVPFTYNVRLLENKKNYFSFHTGFNLIFKSFRFPKTIITPPKENYVLIEDTPSGGILNIKTITYNTSKLAFSFDIGFNYEFVVLKKQPVIFSLYYEQGIKKIVSSTFVFFNYNNINTSKTILLSNLTKGNGIQFKLLFPLIIKK